MNRIIVLASLIFAAGCATNPQHENQSQTPPMAKKIPFEMTEHGDTRVDNYYWMRLSDEQKNAPDSTRDQQTKDVLDYLNAENAYTKSVLAHTDAFQVKLFEEMKGRIKETDQSVPVKDNG
jgi:oligopeptidase B